MSAEEQGRLIEAQPGRRLDPGTSVLTNHGKSCATVGSYNCIL